MRFCLNKIILNFIYYIFNFSKKKKISSYLNNFSFLTGRKNYEKSKTVRNVTSNFLFPENSNFNPMNNKQFSFTNREIQRTQFLQINKAKMKQFIKPKEAINLENYDSKDLNNSSFNENNEFLNIDIKESFTENRKDFLNNLKSFEANKNENLLDISKGKIESMGNSSAIQPIKKRNSGKSNKNETNQLKIPKNLLIKAGDVSIKSGISNSPVSLSHLKVSTTSPKKPKMAITIKKLNRPSFFNKTPKHISNELRERSIKLLQKKIRSWLLNREYLKKNFRIIFHSPSHEIKILERSPIKKSRQGLDLSYIEKNLKGSLLIIYYKRKLEVRAVFKMAGPQKKLYVHLFDFAAIEKFDENMKIRILGEFFKEIVKSFCVFYDEILMLSNFLCLYFFILSSIFNLIQLYKIII